MRAGEICGLTWDDIDLDDRSLTVRRSMYYNNTIKCWEVKVPKNGKSRIIDFGESLYKILVDSKKAQTSNEKFYDEYYETHFYQQFDIKGKQLFQIYTKTSGKLESRSSRSTEGKSFSSINHAKPYYRLNFVCSKENGEMITTQTLKWLNKVVKSLVPSVPDFHFHGLRHTYATILISNGANMKDVQELLGHSDIKITLNTYSHITKESRRKAIDIFESAIS